MAPKKHFCDGRYLNLSCVERGRRNAVSVEGVRQPVSELDLTELPSRRVNNQAKEEPAKEQKPREEDVKAEEEDIEKETDADDDFSDPGDDDEEDRTQNQDGDDDEDEETESEAPVTQEEVAVPKINEPTGRQESQLESESEPDSEPETETEVSEKDVKEQVQVQSESPVKIQMATVESSPPSDSETDVSICMNLWIIANERYLSSQVELLEYKREKVSPLTRFFFKPPQF